MIEVRRQSRGSRFRPGFRVSARMAWLTTLAVLFAQGIAPSYADIGVSTIGSSSSLRMSVLAWNGGLPSRVAAYLPDRLDPIVTDLDPVAIRTARLVETGVSGGWTSGTLYTAGGTLPAKLDVSYRQTSSGLDAVTSDPADPLRTIAIHVPPPAPEEPQILPVVVIAALILAALAACETMQVIRDGSCADAAKRSCGNQGVKCVTTSSFCGLTACRIHCNGDQGSCD